MVTAVLFIITRREQKEEGRKQRRVNENNIWPKLVFLTKHLVFLFQRALVLNENELIPIRKSFWILTGKCLVLNERALRESFVHVVLSLAVFSLVELCDKNGCVALVFIY